MNLIGFLVTSLMNCYKGSNLQIIVNMSRHSVRDTTLTLEEKTPPCNTEH